MFGCVEPRQDEPIPRLPRRLGYLRLLLSPVRPRFWGKYTDKSEKPLPICNEFGYSYALFGSDLELDILQARKACSPMHERAQAPTITILVVDDQPQILGLLQEFLDECGFHVLAASSGSEAERIVSGHANNIHLLITDIELPDGNGIKLARTIKSQRTDMAVIYMSGNLEGWPESSADFMPGAIVMEKPVVFDELRAAISRLLG